METTTNLEKHTTKNPIGRYFLDSFTKKLVQKVASLHPSSILDVGAGEGFTLHMLANEQVGKKREGIEYNEEAITLGKKLHPDVSIKHGDIYNLPYKANSFDVVICSEVLEHLEDPAKALAELKRVSKQYVVLSVPHEPYFTIQRFLRGKNIMKLGDHPEHIQHWSASSFSDFVSKEIIIQELRTPLPWILVVAKK